MAIETTFKTLSSDYERELDGKQIVMQCNFDTQSRGGVTKVCAVSGDVQICKAQAMAKQIKTSGRLSLKLVYLDGERRPASFDYISDFAEDINNDMIIADMPCMVRANVVDIQASIVNNEIKVQTVVELVPVIMEISTIDVLEDVQGALTLKEERYFQKYMGMVDEEFEIYEEYNVGVAVDEVLLYDSKAIVCDVKNEDGKLIVSGNTQVSIVYTSAGEVESKSMNIPFAQEVAIKGDNLKACIVAKVKESKLVIQGEDNDNTFKAVLTINVAGFVMQQTCEQMVVDLYSPTNKLDISTSKLEFTRQDGVRKFEERISGSVTVEDKEESIREILCCIVTQNALSSVVAMDNSVLAEGVLNTSVLYVNQDNENKCMQVELPYSLQFDCGEYTPDTMLSACAIAMDCTHKTRRDREVEICANIVVSVCATTKICQDIICGVQEGEECEHNSNAVSIYLPDKGESIWQVAKTLGMSIDSIKEQNPYLEDEMMGDERIVIYREIC